MADIEIPLNPRGGESWLDGIRWEDVILPEGENMGILSEDEEDEMEEIKSDTGFGSVIIVDNLPVVPPEKHEKLVNVVKKIYGQIAAIREGGLWMPVDQETNKTKGYAFIEFCTPEEADTAVQQTNGYKLDKSHIFAVNKFDDFDRYEKVPETYVPCEVTEYQPRENLQQWMADERGRDQFVIRYGDATEIYWNDAAQHKAEDVYRREFWTESYVQWSPRGSFLTTVHRQGVAIWGGKNWTRMQRFDHPVIQFIDWSPCEKYLFTCSSHDPVNPRDPQTVNITVHDVRSGKKLRTFSGPMSEFNSDGSSGLKWPVFKWAGTSMSAKDTGAETYFARQIKNAISVYTASNMSMLDKKSIKMENVEYFEWSPTDSIMSIYQPEAGNQPSRITLLAIPSRQEIRQKNLFSVSDTKFYWQSSGEYLAVKVDRYTKTKKSTYTGFELFRVKEKECPMEVLELENKSEKIVAFAWEPKGPRFAIIHGDGPRPDITFYTMIDKLGRCKKLGTLKGKSANALYWSPQGKNIVLAGLKSLNGQLEFFNVDEWETLASTEHFMCTDVDWDPTGRYVTTSVTSVHQMENGCNVWTFNGKLLYRLPRDRFFQFLWRPRIPSLLSEEQEADIVKNLKTYSKRYDSMDEELQMQQDSEMAGERQALLDEWNEWYRKKKAELEEQRDEREALQGYYEEDEGEEEEVTVEDVIDIVEEIIAM
mmetsp:Transcript_36262/g.43780  ORF Transcript_36262/g.43780 Transcript_36262/m.43780 type:complete len:706 (-) Transcript_36262:230-2347(-)|eukprot:CAMPEP_0197864814 /NCGR_PEP_ID=MMETSP1438-20131217/43306_1 /TAXON_ID=1461541 /ORGANISM="Pterosperma sp., Strain CCMP1384" /LENGTH=705 /DNA_ID=CAMNT_0043483187 /DNA_START=73 /DNA_END=2190 /DNA_ORIENTATION=+